jgi:uncharacterized membrane protein SpoIIM required for sporulation
MAIDERAFINKKRTNWERLSLIVERTKTSGLGRLAKDELQALGSLYRRAVADLAYARAQGANPNLVLYLNELVGNAHGVLYTDESQAGWGRMLHFLTTGLPSVLRRKMPFIAASFLLGVLGALVAYGLVRANEANQGLFIPPQLAKSVDAWKQGFADSGDVPAGEGIEFASQLMTHNTTVGIVAFATGITFLLPIYFMFQNGAIMGALIAIVQPTHHLTSMWAGILPHGVCELSAIFICGGAGMSIAWSLIAPGQRARRDAVVLAGKEAAMMMVGAVPLFIIAGIIEGNISHSSLPHWVKFSFAAVQFAALGLYIYGRPAGPKSSDIDAHA